MLAGHSYNHFTSKFIAVPFSFGFVSPGAPFARILCMFVPRKIHDYMIYLFLQNGCIIYLMPSIPGPATTIYYVNDVDRQPNCRNGGRWQKQMICASVVNASQIFGDARVF